MRFALAAASVGLLAGVGAGPGHGAPAPGLSSRVAAAVSAQGVSVPAAPVRYAEPVAVSAGRPQLAPSEAPGLRRSAAVLARGRGVVVTRSIEALIGSQIAARPGVRGADERSQAYELAASQAVAADLTPRVLRALGVGGVMAPVGQDGSRAELSVQAMWLRAVSTQVTDGPTSGPGARAFRLRFLRATDAGRAAMVAGRQPVPPFSGPPGD